MTERQNCSRSDLRARVSEREKQKMPVREREIESKSDDTLRCRYLVPYVHILNKFRSINVSKSSKKNGEENDGCSKGILRFFLAYCEHSTERYGEGSMWILASFTQHTTIETNTYSVLSLPWIYYIQFFLFFRAY